jgi:hypothetical protein
LEGINRLKVERWSEIIEILYRIALLVAAYLPFQFQTARKSNYKTAITVVGHRVFVIAA